MNWQQMNELDELTYRANALISVVSDGLLSEPCPSSNEDSATVLNLVSEKLERVREIHAEMWEKQREQKTTFNVEEEGEDEDGHQKFTIPSQVLQSRPPLRRPVPPQSEQRLGITYTSHPP